MASSTSPEDNKIYALINYEDAYVQPLILSALEKCLPPLSYHLITSLSDLPKPTSRLLQFVQYEAIDWDHLTSHPTTSLANAYVIRKALIRKHYLSTTIANWVTKYPDSVLKDHVKSSVEFEEWDPESSDDEDENARSDINDANKEEKQENDGIITSQLRHFIAQPYIHPPLLLPPPQTPQDTSTSTSSLRKFHIRTYVLATGALQVYIYRPMLALFAARPYLRPWDAALQKNRDEAMRAHLTNTCLQESGDREGSVGLFWDLPDELPTQPEFSSSGSTAEAKGDWKSQIFTEIQSITGATFEAAARGMGIHFQPLPNAFEVFGLDFMVSVEEDGGLKTWLLEVNAFPDFRQTGDELKGLVEGLLEGVVGVGIGGFFGVGGEKGREEKMVKVLDIDLGRR
ncbi:tubulin-tyrosine ligase [Pyrenophora tritici-repentis]|uniref:Tubulin-tyrosine ligase family protein n=1 Tax=Pyrenophora tritici-repentis TaxID=45151 RepID=A0A5M9KWF5_9PLEO|nr:tubulin-tyrosine ligase [Pyrenophora tritici-repentis]KAF7443988.1 tubulin-tyrosine ligase [Pyrenophora tritici-repentis]KAF7566290.1 tubulin-tyrosine ligase family protein [Pyrenophora tritici-repentis]KAI0573717.1 tubulin-tyrosine ligase [Pyrenophora tritici-repentis]KAI0574711.1 tubulin-tyrosine ligase [Pyrenophora tritici-repentis]